MKFSLVPIRVKQKTSTNFQRSKTRKLEEKRSKSNATIRLASKLCPKMVLKAILYHLTTFKPTTSIKL